MKSKVSTQFEELYKKLNSKQKEAVDAIEGPVMVVAGPGTGKTQILTLRIANILLKTDSKPENILALTFTEAGAHAMRKRLVDIIGSAAYKVNIYTFHGFCNDIIKQYPEEFPRLLRSKNASEIDQIKLIEEILLEGQFEYVRPYGDAFYYVRPILSSIRDLKREGVHPEQFSTIIKKQSEEFRKIPDLYYDKGAHKGKMKGMYKDVEKAILKNTELASVYNCYEMALLNSKLYDYEDMIIEVVKALKARPEFLLILQEQYQYILADEHQDTNNAQNQILELLASFHENPNLFIVGDEKQAIFRFQGASLDNFLYFKKLYPNVLLINLEDNYRSTQNILDSAHSVIVNTKVDDEKLRTKLKANRTDGDDAISICAFNKPDYELLHIVTDVEQRIQSGTPAEEIAILYRDNRDSEALIRMFEKTSIPYVLESDENIFAHEVTRKLILLLKAIHDFGNNVLLSHVLHISFLGLNNLDVYKVVNYASKKRISLYDVIKDEILLVEAGVHTAQFTKLFSRLSAWNKASHEKHLLEVLDQVVNESGLIAHLVTQNGSVRLFSKLGMLYDHIKALASTKNHFSVADLITHLETLDMYGILVKKSGKNIEKGVRLMTTHRSKGQEFDYVYIVGVTDGHWGNRTSRSLFKISLESNFNLENVGDLKGNNNDERRLFYVALTRGRKGVIITYSKENNEGKSELPSQFLEEINPKFVHHIETDDLEDAFKTKPEFVFAPKKNFGPELHSKEYLNQLFVTQGLSVTALNNYLACPWRYFYSNLIRIPRIPNKFQMYGNAVDAALQYYFEKVKIGEKPSKEYLLKKFEDILSNEPLSLQEFEEARTRGVESLSGYFDLYNAGWKPQILNQYKVADIELPTHYGNVLLNGKLDKIEFIDDIHANVVDYKTGKPKSRNILEGKTKNADGNYKRQLIFYKLLLENDKNRPIKMISGEIDFVEPDDKGRYHRERFEISDEDVVLLKDEIKRVSEEIYDLSFWDKECDDKECEYCILRKLMR